MCLCFFVILCLKLLLLLALLLLPNYKNSIICLYITRLSFFIVVQFFYFIHFQRLNNLQNIIFIILLNFITNCFTTLYNQLSVILITFIISIII